MSEKKPFEIARETLKQLSARKLAPTSANYQKIYSEVSGVPIEHPFPAERLRGIAQDLPTRTPGQQRQMGLLDSAIDELDWDAVKAALMAYGGFSPAAPAQSGASPPPVSVLSPSNGSATAPALTDDFFEQVARLIEYALPALGSDDARFTEQTQAVLKAMRQPGADVLALKQMLGSFGSRLSFAAEDQEKIRGKLQKLLHLIIENLGELSLDDRWLKGKTDALLLASSPPLTLPRLDDVERRMKDVIFKLTEAKGRAIEAQEEMCQMLATFIERLSQMTGSTSAFHGKMEENAHLIEHAKTLKAALMAHGGFSPAAPAQSSASSPPASALLPSNGSTVAENAYQKSHEKLSGALLPSNGSAAAEALTADFFEQVARLIEYALPALGSDDARFAEQTQALLKAMRQPGADMLALKPMLGNFGSRLSFAAEDQAEIRGTLLKLLHLIIENIGELSLDDRWLKGQIDALLLASSPPLTLPRLDDVERRLKDVIFKQTEAKGRAIEAQEEMRQMLATFIERLSQMTESTSAFHGKMEENARLIEQAKTLTEIAPVLKEVVSATRSMAHDSLSVRDELRGMREKAQATEAELVKLHEELDRVSAQARHDTLTGALNRKGLDEAVEREVSNVRRKETPLCVSMLDIDNFKRLNDRLGHAAGDGALAHLVAVTRDAMRPQDTLARYGGEEFVILMPDTPLASGVEAMTRLQRELTKRFFLTGSERVLITFSAGVTQLAPNEAGADAIKRADQAMYLAKRAGKNRVLGA